MQKLYTNKEYLDHVEKEAPKSKVARNIVRAFFVGGFICIIGQFLNNILAQQGIGKDAASNITVLIMVFLGAFFTGINIYDDIGRFAGAGSIVPITGFANSIVSPAMEFKSEGYVTGVGARMFFIAGPVLVYGISASVVAGILHYLITLSR
ncbi:MAG: stage V sporulation protein AC [Bacillota bacterium]|nr:stage V sporulation protein AC [Bacillota bacterium]